MSFRSQDIKALCSSCDTQAAGACARCGRPHCGEHASGADRRCDSCEEDFRLVKGNLQMTETKIRRLRSLRAAALLPLSLAVFALMIPSNAIALWLYGTSGLWAFPCSFVVGVTLAGFCQWYMFEPKKVQKRIDTGGRRRFLRERPGRLSSMV